MYLGEQPQPRNTIVEAAVQVCSDDQFDCQDSLSTCLDREQLCDGNPDCEGGEDELNCGMCIYVEIR